MSCSVIMFIKMLEVTNKPGDCISLKVLYDVYFTYCMENNEPALNKRMFANTVDQLCVPKVSLGGNVTGFRGLKLGDDLEWYL